MKVLLIDFFNIFIRSFAIIPTRSNVTGEHNGGLFGTLLTIRSLTEKFNPDRVILICDGSGGSLRRRKLYEGYKSSRRIPKRLNRTFGFETIEDEKESMQNQFVRLLQYIEALPVTFIRIDNIEADDTIAYIASLNQETSNYIIVSTDKDFLQLISKSCQVYNPIKKKLYDIKAFREEWQNVNPENFILIKTLTGDASDDIMGLSGMGPKTAIKIFPLLTEDKKHTVNSLLEFCEKNIGDIKKGKKNWYEVVLRNKDQLILNHKLMQLHNVDIGLALETKINDIYSRLPKTVSPFSIRKLFLSDKMFSQLKAFNQWAQIFGRLSIKSKKTMTHDN